MVEWEEWWADREKNKVFYSEKKIGKGSRGGRHFSLPNFEFWPQFTLPIVITHPPKPEPAKNIPIPVVAEEWVFNYL